jgi:S1-C subfamily serine protease
VKKHGASFRPGGSLELPSMARRARDNAERGRCAEISHCATVIGVAVLSLVIAMTDAGRASARPSSKGVERVAPTVFGRVFEENRASLVRVTTAGEAGSANAKAWWTGFVIGARGEVVFGAPGSPSVSLVVRTHDGVDHQGELLGFDPDLKLAVARIAADGGANRIAPVRVASVLGLIERRWVVVLKYDAQGRAEPFAGLVEADAQIDRTNRSKRDLLLAPVAAPGAPGSPVLSSSGELVGIALLEGRRNTRAVAIETFVPFLRTVVLGSRQ